MAQDLYQLDVKKIDGTSSRLGDYQGQVLLIVNVASKCGLTPQYDALEKIYKQYRDKGFSVLGFPSNEFMGQEPGTHEEIQQFCRVNFGVDFPLFEKISVKGEGKHPLYRALTSARPQATAKPDSTLSKSLAQHGLLPKDPTEVMWNFEKFLVNRQGQVVERFAPDVTPDDELVTKAIERELAQ